MLTIRLEHEYTCASLEFYFRFSGYKRIYSKKAKASMNPVHAKLKFPSLSLPVYFIFCFLP